ncbi:thioredoxin family protein [Halapricum desulfuricans]|uniref:Thiol-disulfide isomerase or thioredoxin n=1 Tax=Halapricum desulfuricans TaxID=2841257 RepID=A0A897NKV7_9EURY|nr:thioredoxin family protein [Halapricum desulfuricans]QSG10348.1 Thiol-disulfide isomerase or thioredoxin [Halapricum desulfuricans]QSG13298.1 Thiol-disulfide isomerase or thioredoxin [Halapricum desulfuricans]
MSTPFNAEQPPERPVDLADGDELTAFVETYDDVLVEFYTDGCGVCASMEPVLSGVARSGAVVGTINPRDDPPLVDEYRIASVPTFVRFRDGEPVDRISEGFVPGEQLQAFAQG